MPDKEQRAMQARNSLESAQHAVDQAESHPSSEKLDEADNALASAQAAVRQAKAAGSDEAPSMSRQLEEERSVIEGDNR